MWSYWGADNTSIFRKYPMLEEISREPEIFSDEGSNLVSETKLLNMGICDNIELYFLYCGTMDDWNAFIGEEGKVIYDDDFEYETNGGEIVKRVKKDGFIGQDLSALEGETEAVINRRKERKKLKILNATIERLDKIRRQEAKEALKAEIKRRELQKQSEAIQADNKKIIEKQRINALEVAKQEALSQAWKHHARRWIFYFHCTNAYKRWLEHQIWVLNKGPIWGDRLKRLQKAEEQKAIMQPLFGDFIEFYDNVIAKEETCQHSAI